MLDLPRYLLGVAEIACLAGFATLGATALRARLLPMFAGAPAQLATAVIALALLIWVAEVLGSIGAFAPIPCMLAVSLIGTGLWALLARRRGSPMGEGSRSESEHVGERRRDRTRSRRGHAPGLIALVVAALAVVKFGIDVKSKLGTGMTGFDSTWYHAPFAAGFFQTGNTWDLHFIAPQFLAWFYPANGEIFHAAGMLAFDRDLLSPLLNLGWFVGCLVACWCIGRPYRAAPWSLALGAVALSLPVLSDQAGEARNDIVGIFFLLAAVAISLNAWRDGSAGATPSAVTYDRIASKSHSGALVAGLAAGLAAGTKLNFLLPAAVLVLGLAFVAPAGARRGALGRGVLAALAGGGYWYLRNLLHTGNPLPWFDDLGPISLPAPEQALGGREGHSVLGYLFDGSVWSDWFLPGLHGGFTFFWPLLLVGASTGLVLCIPWSWLSQAGGAVKGKGGLDAGQKTLAVVALTGLAVVVAWLIAPTSASGPEGMPRGFESGLRYLAPAVVLGLTLLPMTILPRLAWGGPPGKARCHVFRLDSTSDGRERARRKTQRPPGVRPHDRTRRPLALGALAILALAIALGYPVQRHYLENRYADPTFAAPGLNAAFAWANGVSDSRIATTSTRQYPLFGADLTNRVQFVGEERPSGGFVAPTSCRRWRRLLDAGDYDYVVTSRDRLEPGRPTYPASTHWTEGLGVEEILRKPPTVVFELKGPLDPSSCG